MAHKGNRGIPGVEAEVPVPVLFAENIRYHSAQIDRGFSMHRTMDAAEIGEWKLLWGRSG